MSAGLVMEAAEALGFPGDIEPAIVLADLTMIRNDTSHAREHGHPHRGLPALLDTYVLATTFGGRCKDYSVESVELQKLRAPIFRPLEESRLPVLECGVVGLLAQAGQQSIGPLAYGDPQTGGFEVGLPLVEPVKGGRDIEKHDPPLRAGIEPCRESTSDGQ